MNKTMPNDRRVVPESSATAPAPEHSDGPGAAPGEQSTGELVSQATQQLTDLVRGELRLAVAEMKDKGRHAGKGAGLFGGAGLVALYGAAALVAAVIAALALVWPVWASALLVGAVLLAVAGVLALVGRKQMAQAAPPLPEQAIDSTKQDLDQIKESAHR
ncbi:phage holin family protein [Actinomadura kijaniata]|uniref:phage holin family protein n=1 Tax=Actinomadura kijaniata TaxID=46161 RepID=UPI003F1B800A